MLGCKENDVYSLLRFLMMVFVSMAVWMAIGLGVGFLLHGVVPAIDLGMATLIGVVTLGGCFLWLSRISTLETLYGHDLWEAVCADVDGGSWWVSYW